MSFNINNFIYNSMRKYLVKEKVIGKLLDNLLKFTPLGETEAGSGGDQPVRASLNYYN